MKANKTAIITFCLIYLGSIQCALADGGYANSPAPAQGSQYISHIFGSQEELNAMYEKSPSSKDPLSATTQISSDSGVLQSDRVTMDADRSFQDMLRNPIAEPTFEQDVASILNGKKKMIQAQCECRYYEHDGGKLVDLGTIVSFGASRGAARENSLRNCFQDAYTTETQSLDLKNHSVDALWGQLGHVQAISVPACRYSNFKFDLNFLLAYKQQHARELNQAAQSLSDSRSGQSSVCLGLGNKLPNWAKTGIAALLGGFAWRARGGSIALGSTLAARLVFGFAPFLLNSCLVARNQKQLFDGFVMGALMTAPLFYATYSHLQGQGYQWDPHTKYLDHVTFGPPTQDPASARDVRELGQAGGMSLYGYGMETFFAMAYAKWRGYDPTPLALAGLAWGPCYNLPFLLTPSRRGYETKDRVTQKLQIHYAGQKAEACVGAAMYAGMAMTLEEGQVRDVDNNGPHDLIHDAPGLAKEFIMRARDTGLVDTATLQRFQYSTPDLIDHSGINPVPAPFPDRP